MTAIIYTCNVHKIIRKQKVDMQEKTKEIKDTRYMNILQLASGPWLIACTQRAYDMHLGISRPWLMCMASDIECCVFACVALTGLQAHVVPPRQVIPHRAS
jgi:hypothetical protein